MSNQSPSQVYYMQQNEIQQQNEDLIRLRQMNQAFAKMNEQHLYDGYEYYTYQPQEVAQLQSFEQLSAQQGIEHRENEQLTERSNSLLFTLSEKDDQETRPATNVHNVHYQYGNNGEILIHDPKINPHNTQKFGSYEYDPMRSMTVNNTLTNNPFNITEPQTNGHTYQQHFYYNNNSNDTQRYHLTNQQQVTQYAYMDQTPQNSVISNGFSKYEEFAVKISKLFNIQVEDLQIIYNQLKYEKQTELYHQQNSLQTGQFLQNVQISDSEVMKKLFSYALEIKNSHNKLKSMITTIDHRKGRRSEKFSEGNYERPQQHIPQKNNEIQNISINFMLEQENNQNKSKIHQYNQKDDQTQRYQSAKTNMQNDLQNIQSKKTIIQKLVGQKGYLNSQLVSQQTIQSHSSYAESALTNAKTNKSRKNSRVTEKIKLISEQLQSLKKQIDLEEEGIVQEKQYSNQRIENPPTLFPKEQIAHQSQKNSTIVQKTSGDQLQTQYSYLPKMAQQKSQYIIQVNNSQIPVAKKEKIQPAKESQVHTFGGQSFTYVKSLEEIPMNDPEIDFKIQQTIKTCIVKSPSKKIIPNPQVQETEPTLKPQQNTALVSSEKKSQKIIVEQSQISNSRSKYSFRQNSQAETKDNNETMITSPTKSQSRQKMFKSIAQLRKSNASKDRHQRGKTTNNAYLEDEEMKIEEGSYPKNVFKNNAPIQQNGSSSSLSKTKFFSKQVMRDGKLVFEKVQNTDNQTPLHIRQTSDQQKKTATFGVISPSQTQKVIPNHSSISQIDQTQVSSQSVSHNLIPEPHQVSKKMLSLGVPSSLYSAKTIQSRPFLESDHELPHPSIRQPIHISMTPNFNKPIVVKQPYSYTPKMPQMNSNPNKMPSNPIVYQPVQVRSPQKTIVFNQMPQELIARPVTPINKIQNINFHPNEKPRSFSVEKINPNKNVVQQQPIFQNKTLPNNSSQIKILSPSQQYNQVGRPNIIFQTPITERKVVQRPFSVPIRSMTPQKSTPINFQQTLIEKPKPTIVQNSFKKQEPKSPVIINQFELKPHNEQKSIQMIKIAPQPKTIVQQQRPLYASIRQKSLNDSKHIASPSPVISNSTLNDSKFHNQKIQPILPNLPAQFSQSSFQQKSNPRLQESEMYYGQLQASRKQPNNQGTQNYQEMNLMSSRQGESVVHAFPVQLEQSQKMNNSIYAKEDFSQNESQNKSMSKPVYGQIITYQPPTSPKGLPSPTNQFSRIPTNFRPPKYIPLKEPQPLLNNRQFEKPSPPKRLDQSSKPPIKTYTMGHLLQASRTERYMQESIADDRKSNTALNASNVAGRINDLHDSTPSFGRINDEANSQSVVVMPFGKEFNNLNQSRNSSVSKRSSSSRSRSNKKGIALESKRDRTPSHQFFQSSYYH